MKISELIRSLEYSLKTYGNLTVAVSTSDTPVKGTGIINEHVVLDDTEIWLQEMPDRGILSIQNFPY